MASMPAPYHTPKSHWPECEAHSPSQSFSRVSDLPRRPAQTPSFPLAGLASSLTLRRTMSQALLAHLMTS